MQALKNFNPDLQWYTGQGCLVCGMNYTKEGEEAGIQCLDLDVDGYDGHLGLCYNHAREVGTHVGMVGQDQLDALEAEIAHREENVHDNMETVIDVMRQAAADREVVERLISPSARKRQPKAEADK